MFELEVLPTWLYWLLVGCAAIVAIAQAGRIMKTVSTWVGDIVDERLRQTVRPMLREYSPNGEVTEIKTLIELHIIDSQRQFDTIQAELNRSKTADDKIYTSIQADIDDRAEDNNPKEA